MASFYPPTPGMGRVGGEPYPPMGKAGEGREILTLPNLGAKNMILTIYSLVWVKVRYGNPASPTLSLPNFI